MFYLIIPLAFVLISIWAYQRRSEANDETYFLGKSKVQKLFESDEDSKRKDV